jgi:Zn finger protein HypA/HybF involved in hydrogenase expression
MTTNKKHTYEYVKDFIEKEGYFLLSEIYLNNRTKMKLKCNKEHFFEMCFNSFQSGHRCPTCASIQKNINQKNDYDYVKKYVEKIGFSLIDNNYINNRTKLTIQCEHGHIFKTTFHTFHKNYKCPICDRNKKYTISEISDYLMKYKYELISNNYNNNKDYLTIKCPIGHILK